MHDLHLGEIITLGEDYTGVVGFFWGADYPWLQIYHGELQYTLCHKLVTLSDFRFCVLLQVWKRVSCMIYLATTPSLAAK